MTSGRDGNGIRPGDQGVDDREDVRRRNPGARCVLRHVERGVFPGGCFFASVTAEMDTHPGPVRDSVLEVEDELFRRLETAARDAQAEGTIDPAEDPAQLAFELSGYMLLGNAQFVVSQEPTPIDRARRAVQRRLAAAAPAAIT